MSFTVIVSAEPAPLDEDRSPTTTVFPISCCPDHAAVEIPGTVTAGFGPDIGEVICRGTLAEQAREQLHAGQQIMVVGELAPRPSLNRTSDGTDVVLVIEATQIGWPLADTDVE